MKKLIKKHKNKFLFLACILFAGISYAGATIYFAASNVTYSNSNMSATNVQDAIEELHAKAAPCNPTGSYIIKKMELNITTSGDGLYVDDTDDTRYVYKGSNPNNYIIPFINKYKFYVDGDGGEGMWGSTDTLEQCQNYLQYANSYYEGTATCELNTETNKYYTKVKGFYKNSSFDNLTACVTGKNNFPVKHGISCKGTGDLWRIISIESDGTIKVIKDEAITSMVFDADDATRRKTGYCTSNYCNAWAAMSSFTNGTQTGAVSLDSSVKEYIDGTYAPTIDTNKIATKTWNISGTEYNRDTLANAIADEKKQAWNGKIALLTASEYVRANSNTASCGTLALLSSNYSTCKSTNYLVKSSTWWLLSPSSSSRINVLGVASNSLAGSYSASSSYGVRPVLYLCKGLKYSGKGTSSEPYEISGRCVL